jgi:hypothetical protein
MAGSVTCEIRFIGGPLDGYRETRPPGQVGLAEVLAVPINSNLLTALVGERRGPKKPASSVAVYELQILDGVVEYRFVGQTTARQLRLEQWSG